MIESPAGGRAAAWEETRHQMADELGVWAKTLEPLKTALAIKGFVGTALDRPENARAGAAGADVSTSTVALVTAWVPSLPTRSEIRSR